jgi:hypothetical protein
MMALPESLIALLLANLADQDTATARTLAEQVQRNLKPVEVQERSSPRSNPDMLWLWPMANEVI